MAEELKEKWQYKPAEDYKHCCVCGKELTEEEQHNDFFEERYCNEHYTEDVQKERAWYYKHLD